MRIRSLGLVAVIVVGASSAHAQTYLPTASYSPRRMAGFEVLVDPAIDAQPDTAAGLAVLSKELAKAARILPRKAVADLRAVRIFVEGSSPGAGCATYHQDGSRFHKADVNPDKLKSIELNLPCFTERLQSQPLLLVHELALAYLDRGPGWNAPALLAAFERAGSSRLYESVPYFSGGMAPAPALESPQRFFAESSESFFGGNDYFPFDAVDLARFDRATCDFVEQVWAKPGVCDGRKSPPAKKRAPKPAKKASTKRATRSGR